MFVKGSHVCLAGTIIPVPATSSWERQNQILLNLTKTQQNSKRTLFPSRETPYTSPSEASYVILIVTISYKIHYLWTMLRCIITNFTYSCRRYQWERQPEFRHTVRDPDGATCCTRMAPTPHSWNHRHPNCEIKKQHDDVIKWKHFPHYWPFVRGIHRSPVNPHKGQWRGALMFS